jgi:hypothetical protein
MWECFVLLTSTYMHMQHLHLPRRVYHDTAPACQLKLTRS